MKSRSIRYRWYPGRIEESRILSKWQHPWVMWLEKVTVEAYPVIAQIKECMMEAGALGAMMSGSGPTVFGIFRDRRTAKEAFTKVKAQNLAKQIYLANVHNVRRR